MTQLIGNSRVQGIRAPPFYYFYAAIAIAGFLSFSACATTPQPPHEALQAAELAISSAEQARVADYASSELNQAREKLAAARTAVRNEQMAEAQYLAEESRVHADLASAQAEEIRAKSVNDEMQKSIDTLKQEMQRISGVRQ